LGIERRRAAHEPILEIAFVEDGRGDARGRIGIGRSNGIAVGVERITRQAIVGVECVGDGRERTNARSAERRLPTSS
jgi:hypothetical protein